MEEIAKVEEKRAERRVSERNACACRIA